MNKHFKVTMTEIGPRGVHTFSQKCFAPTRAEVIRIYGLDQSDILDYTIEEIAPTLKSIAEDYGKDASEQSELPEEVASKIVSLVKKYSDKERDIVSFLVKKKDINLKKPMYLSSRDSNVYAFYLFQNWIYLLDEDGDVIDPNDVELDFLESFLEYISDESNLG